MSRAPVHVIPPGAEQLLTRMLDSQAARAQGWLFRGARVQDREVHAAYQHRSTGAVRTFVLVHPGAVAGPALRTERFAIMPRGSTAGSTDAAALAEWIAESLRAAERSFTWHEIEGDDANPHVARDAHECLVTCAPLLRRFLDGLDEQDPRAVEAAQKELLPALASRPSSPMAARVGARVLGALRQPVAALAWIDARLAHIPTAARTDLLREKLELAARLGFRDEATATLGALCNSTHPGAEAFDAAATFHHDRGDHERAAPFAREAANRDPAMKLRAAAILAAAGHLDEARALTAHFEPPTSGEALLQAARALGEAGDFDTEERALLVASSVESSRVAALTRLAQLASWRGRFDEAAQLAARAFDLAPSDPAVQRCRAASLLFLGEIDQATIDLDAAATRDPDNVETLILRAEILWRRGKLTDARAVLDRAQLQAGSFGPLDILSGLVRAEAGEYGGSYAPFAEDYVARLPVSVDLLDRLGLTMAPARETPAQTLRRWLDLLFGNRSTTLTTFSEERGLSRLRDEDNARLHGRIAQDLLLTRSADDVLSYFATVVERHAEKPYALCYRGELLLWLGRYADARQDFLSALSIRKDTRWAYVGLGAADLFEGDPRSAIDILDHGAVIAKGAGPTTFAYRGEAYRLLGDHERAIADLTRTCNDWPHRVGAWINLALAHSSVGNHVELRNTFMRLQRIAPGLMAEACAETLVDGTWTPPFEEQRRVLERARAMLRGNRSSTLGTWFNASGQLRAARWGGDDPAASQLDWLRSATPVAEVPPLPGDRACL